MHYSILPDRNAGDAAARMGEAIRQGERGRYAVTLNPKLLAEAGRSPAYARILQAADYPLCDGIGGKLILRAGSPKGCAIPRIPGIELGEAILQIAAERGLPVFFLGGAPGIAVTAARRLQQRFPHLPVAGTAHGYHPPAHRAKLITAIRASGARIVIVCLGVPLQEQWIARNRPYLPDVALFLPLGGSLDVWAGKLRRAPRPLRVAGLEWLWRIACQPHRLRGLVADLRCVLLPPAGKGSASALRQELLWEKLLERSFSHTLFKNF